MSETIEYPQDATPVKNRKPLKIALSAIGAAAVLVAGSWGGIAFASNLNAQQAHTEAVALQHQVEHAKPVLEAQTAAIGAESDATTADASVAAEKQREADALAAQQAAAAAAKAAAVKSRSSASWSPGQAPAGTPIPLHLDTDPNSGSYGQMVIEPPETFCASNGGTTAPNGQAVCS